MIKRLLQCVREYKKATVLTLIFIVGESVIETLIPFITARMVNDIKAGAPISDVIRIGGVLDRMRLRRGIQSIESFFPQIK